MLRRDGEEAHLEHKVMKLLCVLAARPGEVLSRDALIDEVWDGNFGADASLTRAVSLIRQAFRAWGCDDPIETVPKRGYRLTAPVSTTGTEAPPPTAPAIARTRFEPRRVALAAGVVFALAALAMLFVWLRDEPAAPASGPPTVAVLPFDAPGDGPAGGAFADRFSSELHGALSRSGPGLRLIGWASSSWFSGERRRLEVVRAELDVSHIVGGAVERADGRIDANVELIDAATGVQVWRDRFSADFRDEEILLARIVRRVREALEISAAQSVSAQSYDPRALELYYGASEGTPFLDRIRALEQAVSIDPDFARAWRGLARLYESRIWHVDTPEARNAAYAAGRRAARRYSELAPDDPEAWVALARFSLDREEGLRRLERAARLDADHASVQFQRIWLLQNSGRGQDALDLCRQARLLDPLRSEITTFCVLAAAKAGRFDRAEETLRDHPTDVLHLWRTVIMARLARGQIAEARTALRAYAQGLDSFERSAAAGQRAERLARLFEDRYAEMEAILDATERSGAEARRALADNLFAQAIDPVDGASPREAYFQLAAISVLDGADRAFAAWERRLGALPPYDPDDPFGPHYQEVAFYTVSRYLPGLRRLQRDPRFWSFAARYDPRAFHRQWHEAPSPPAGLSAFAGGPLWPPEFCLSADFPYDCDTVARAAFAEAASTGGVATGEDGG
ncbi:winged helix-turn-helix domain-containing tetratricopeptide repeat protein [Marinicauda salina]|uniref:winged helix-turn-helix domain-containing tetratricopeptide repeat protein n=1 Tax=Marinicauda salina TaxID=2135793 RepID=UPI001304D109|nr:winged helix-turn-helix domain-containing protein [Marinicauda salina]